MLNPTEDWVYIARSPKEMISEGGIYLPETHFDYAPEGVVQAAGPGRLFGNGCRSNVFSAVGALVLFNENDWVPYGNDREATHGFVRDSDLLGYVDDEGLTLPLNSYVKIEAHGRQAVSDGGVIIADVARKLPKTGRICTWGYGSLRKSGMMAGTRQPVADILNVEEGDLSGMIAHWEDAQDDFYHIIDPGGPGCFFVPAEAIIALEASNADSKT